MVAKCIYFLVVILFSVKFELELLGTNFHKAPKFEVTFYQCKRSQMWNHILQNLQQYRRSWWVVKGSDVTKIFDTRGDVILFMRKSLLNFDQEFLVDAVKA